MRCTLLLRKFGYVSANLAVDENQGAFLCFRWHKGVVWEGAVFAEESGGNTTLCVEASHHLAPVYEAFPM
jgi:hypothetical protein